MFCSHITVYFAGMLCDFYYEKKDTVKLLFAKKLFIYPKTRGFAYDTKTEALLTIVLII